MESVSAAAPGLVCLPSAIPASERAAHFALARELFGECAKERHALPEGHAFRFEVHTLESVARFVSNERRCCPFVSFDITLPANGQELWLRMTGPEGTREVLEAELSLIDSGTCACR